MHLFKLEFFKDKIILNVSVSFEQESAVTIFSSNCVQCKMSTTKIKQSSLL